MKNQYSFFLTPLFVLMIFFSSVAQQKPSNSYTDIIVNAETNYKIVQNARIITHKLGIPHTIYTQEGVFIEAKGVENGKVVYAVTPNIADYASGYTAFFEEIKFDYNLATSRQHFVEKPTINPTLWDTRDKSR